MHRVLFRRACGSIAIALSFTAALAPEAGALAPVRHSHRHVRITRARAQSASSAQIEAMIRYAFSGTGQADRAVRIARCESGLQADPPHNNPHYGVFQMGRREFARYGHGDIFNAADNILAAKAYWQAAGWRPWACRG